MNNNTYKFWSDLSDLGIKQDDENRLILTRANCLFTALLNYLQSQNQDW
jgi:hypothetical protein